MFWMTNKIFISYSDKAVIHVFKTLVCEFDQVEINTTNDFIEDLDSL